MDAGVDGAAHADDGIQRDAVELRKLGQQIDGVECAAENRDADAADDQTDQGGVLALMQVIENRGGQDQAAAYGEIGEISHKGGGGALQKQLQQDLDTLAGHGGGGS